MNMGVGLQYNMRELTNNIQTPDVVLTYQNLKI